MRNAGTKASRHRMKNRYITGMKRSRGCLDTSAPKNGVSTSVATSVASQNGHRFVEPTAALNCSRSGRSM
jgi:hypothetical protein